MAALTMREDNSDLASQCMAFCQALASKVQTFSFALNVGSSFSFSLDTRGDGSSTRSKKRKSPSALRRNARRRAEFLQKNSVPSTERKSSEKETAPEKEAEDRNKKVFKCDQCDHDFKSENGLKIHVGKSHKKVNSTPATPDRLRQQPRSSVSLSASPLLDASREETCVNVDAVEGGMSSEKCAFECGSCGSKFSNGEALKIHLANVHKLPMKCPDCDLVFQNFVSFVAHYKVHRGIESDSD